MKTIQFSMGPVQGFVAQARRTRDLFAGSFLLSYLAGHAIREVLRANGTMEFPAVTDADGKIIDPLLAAISAETEGDAVQIGTLPNRLQAKVPESFNPKTCCEAVIAAWRKVAAEVWDEFLEDVAYVGRDVRTIWDRQVGDFWELNWVVGKDRDLLDRRKNWRTFVPSVEPGDKCTVMGTLQELSGFVRSREKEERQRQDSFWQAVRTVVKSKAGTLDLREDERLCAIALIKRLYPRVAKKAIGWEVPVGYPSTSYIAAVPWLAATMKREHEDLADFIDLAKTLSDHVAVSGTRLFPDLAHAARQHPRSGSLAGLDGNCFFKGALENDRLWPEDSAETREKMAKMLSKLSDELASPFYAVLLMDGDHLGALLRSYDGSKVSQALARFSARVASIVRNNNGITVYAGGDDVLALFPVPYVLNAAFDMREAYGEAFREEFGEARLGRDDGTASSAILFAHQHLPLKEVIARAHQLLDDVAKDDTGRDSVAIEVWKGAGIALTWSSPWVALKEGKTDLLTELFKKFSGEGKQEKEMNSCFFYNARARFELLQDSPEWQDEQVQKDLLTAEYVKNRDRQVSIEEARERVGRLLCLCRQSWRDNKGLHVSEGPLRFGGAMLVKFLAGRGADE